MTQLSVNLNKVALLRNQRDVGYPSVVEFARIVIAAGADGVTVHPRPDERHISRTDVYDLAEVVAQSEVELNIEQSLLRSRRSNASKAATPPPNEWPVHTMSYPGCSIKAAARAGCACSKIQLAERIMPACALPPVS